jgi:DNA-binding transcriptional MocR family regulator
MHCGSFTKCLAPGYRVGWAAAGRYAKDVRRNKFLYSIETNVIAQDAIADFVKHRGYEHHLRGLRAALREQLAEMTRAIGRYFPPQIKLWRPQGGYFLWMELPAGVDALVLHLQCLREGICTRPVRCSRRRAGFAHSSASTSATRGARRWSRRSRPSASW